MSTSSKFVCNNSGLIVSLLLLVSSLGFSQEKMKPAVESFESESTLTSYDKSNSNLSISTAHHQYGKSSLEWNWKEPGSFSTSNFRMVTFEESPLKYGEHFPASPTLIMSLYNETPQNGIITISYSKNGKQEVWFDIDLSFKGWRHIWVPFYEMQGNAPKKGAAIDYDSFKISSTTKSGKMFFDDIIFSQYQDDRHQYPDEIVPFIKKNQAEGEDHWMPLISNYKRIQDLIATPITAEDRQDLQKFERLIDAGLVIDKKYKIYMDTLEELYQKLNLKDNGKTIVGPPLTFKEEQVYFDKKQQGSRDFNEIQEFGKVLKKLANFYDRADATQKQEIEKMFINGTKYFLDQGWQAGSSGGTRHHIGYNVREITEAFYTMRGTLKKEGLLNEVGASLQWLFNLGEVLGDEKDFHVNIDYLNTQSYYHLMLIFLIDNQEKQAQLLKAYSNFISTTLAQQNEEWGFKIDGTSWHHNGHYPAYGIGAFKTVPSVIRTLSGTPFRIQQKGHENFKNAFLASRQYSQLYNWGFGNSGRHPLENDGIVSLKDQYLLMALSGNPEATSKIDTDVAAAYLRLWGDEDVINTLNFTNLNGIKKETLPGYHTFPYGATAIHRRNNWAAIIKGYSKYVWASEIYVDENRYGRYPANGTIQLLNEKGEKGSGFQQEGWDWNRYPGGTIIYLPLAELESKMPLIMFRSNETFAGATELGDNGVFGMVLNESKGSNSDGPETKIGYPGKLKAKKSVFSFGDKLICIGTNISSIDDKNPTQTTLFQNFLADTKDKIVTSSEIISNFPAKMELLQNSKSGSWLIDTYGNGYHILSNTPVQIKKDVQNSYDNRYSVTTGKLNAKAKGVKETTGNYATAWIDHGMAPTNASYQYVIYPFQKSEEFKKFGNKLKDDSSFMIKRADSIAHIVVEHDSKTTAYVIFVGKTNLEKEVLKEVSDPSLVMIRQNDSKNLTISAVQPDLNFPEYEMGRYRNYSTAVNLTLTLDGKWKANIDDTVLSVDNSSDVTQISIRCKDGLPSVFNLVKI
jgi:chondroitin-sulfate-ABC endolyase/exolyase